MTSRRCFFRVLQEDLRHKIWMLALSVLGSLLTLPVSYLIYSGERSQYLQYAPGNTALQALQETAFRIEGFYGATICFGAGAVAVLGAVIVGLFGFRYVFQRNMTDLYHSLPVSRRTMFLAGWLSGFLIWFVPYLISLAVTVLLGEYKLAELKKQAQQYGNLSWETWPDGSGILMNSLISSLAILTAFLLVYHLVLLAVMLCGNILNTLTVAGILGAGSVVAWVIFTLLRETYLDTFSGLWGVEFRWVSYTAPLISAVCVLYQRVESFLYEQSALPGWDGFLSGRILIGLLTAIGLGFLAYLIYLRRRSELADQGTAGKAFRLILQTAVSLAAFCGGWMLFWYFAPYSGGAQLVWSIFGGILVGGVVFGVLDVIFNMDFKAFFSHKGLMAGVLAAGLFAGFCFTFDWLGVDVYLPEKEEIAEIAVNADFLGSRLVYSDSGILEEIHIRDGEAAYAFLEKAVAGQREAGGRGLSAYDTYVYSAYNSDYEYIETKVTLKSGRSYYRNYRIYAGDSEPLYALVMEPEYLESRYRISDRARDAFSEISLRRGNIAYEPSRLTKEDEQRIRLICDAYNRDLEENPGAVVRGEGRMLARIYLSGLQGNFQIAVYEGMSHTREALRQANLGYYADPAAAEEVGAIVLTTNLSLRRLEEEDDLAEYIRELYGLTVPADENSEHPGAIGEAAETWNPENPTRETEDVPAGESWNQQDPDSQAEKDLAAESWEFQNPSAQTDDLPAAQTVRDLSVMDGNLELEITDPGEIAELLELLSYGSNRCGYLFGGPEQLYSRVRILEKNGNQYDVCISGGALPEKYIERFMQAAEELLGQGNP
ncbi:MAG: ABC transporter permease [Roseburia sp.]|nr:ABC transporter permease [Roseburia sp.]MCM1097637.1 ABC transporter permease [Ruminococcus flavefaciens]